MVKVVKKKPKPVAVKKKKRGEYTRPTWVACGFDVSTYSMCGAAFCWDATLKRLGGPVTVSHRWTREDDYFKRMREAARPDALLHSMFAQLKILPELDEVFIAVEEPWAFGMQKRMESNSLKQQAQISGAFIGGLLRYGWSQVFEIHNQWWKKVVADALGITTHWTKYGKGMDGKMRAKEFCLKEFPIMPDYPDMISHSKLGLIPRPDGSKAKAVQPDDRYDAVPMALWMKSEIERGM